MVKTRDRMHPDALVADVASRLVTCRREQGDWFINLPMLYPSGSTVVVRVRDENNGFFFVSDMGMGWDEADFMGATHQMYARHARSIAETSGVQFDSHAFFVLRITADRLAGAIVTIGNCSFEAATSSAHSIAEKISSDENDRFYHRLIKVFPGPQYKVERGAHIVGASTHDWPVAALVKAANDNQTIFEAVVNHGNSVAAVFTKFGDIGRLDRPPRRIAVVRSMQELGTYLNVLSPVTTRIIESNASENMILRLAS